MRNLSGPDWVSSPEKRTMDLALSVPLLAGAIPVIAGLSAMVRISEGYSPFYKQPRMGRHNREITIRKIRTLPPDTPTTAGQGHNDPRASKLTQRLRRVGLDELPQLYSVVVGEMSLVGPRPFLDFEYEEAISMLNEDERDEFDEAMLNTRPGLINAVAIESRLSIDPVISLYDRVRDAVNYYKTATPETDLATIMNLAKLVIPASSITAAQSQND